MIVELFKNGPGLAVFKLGTDEIFYLTRPKGWSVVQSANKEGCMACHSCLTRSDHV